MRGVEIERNGGWIADELHGWRFDGSGDGRARRLDRVRL